MKQGDKRKDEEGFEWELIAMYPRNLGETDFIYIIECKDLMATEEHDYDSLNERLKR